MSPRMVLAEHSSAELSDWHAFDRAFGLGHDEDVRAAVVAASVWNAAGGIPENEHSRRAATPGDFFPLLAHDDDNGGDHLDTRPTSHDPETRDVLDDVVDEDDEISRVSEAMRNMWAMWGLRQNAALRAAEQLDIGEPPDDPSVN